VHFAEAADPERERADHRATAHIGGHSLQSRSTCRRAGLTVAAPQQDPVPVPLSMPMPTSSTTCPGGVSRQAQGHPRRRRLHHRPSACRPRLTYTSTVRWLRAWQSAATVRQHLDDAFGHASSPPYTPLTSTWIVLGVRHAPSIPPPEALRNIYPTPSLVCSQPVPTTTSPASLTAAAHRQINNQGLFPLPPSRSPDALYALGDVVTAIRPAYAAERKSPASTPWSPTSGQGNANARPFNRRSPESVLIAAALVVISASGVRTEA